MTTAHETQTSADTLTRAYLTIERMRRRLDEYERTRTEPIAVVGLGCRLPGGAVDADSYWNILSAGTDAVDEIPADRWDAGTFYDERPQQPGRMSTRWGGFLDRVDQFDYGFFGISRREAIAMDPQQRLVLEVAWEALEHAGQAPAELAGSRTGVFMGVCSYDFAARYLKQPLDLTAYASTGTAHSVVTGRLSYTLDLRGPSLAIDSACSSSLVAVHLACQSLRTGESDLALSGGVNVVLSPLPSISFSQFPGMVSPDGRCKTFDSAANGYVRSEGCGIVVLKRLSDAERDGDEVLAVIRGGAVNQDGRSSGVTAPNGLAQRDVLRRALDSSGVSAGQVSYIEAHGTGTRLGDPIEVEALAEVYGRPDGTPVYLGSSKTNIGHLEAASGIAGLIKVVLSLGRDTIPPNVHFEQLNPHLSFEGTTFAVPTALTPWPTPDGRRVAGVSSFGFSGTNAHLIVEQAPPRTPAEPDARRPLSVLTLSAKSERSLVELARRYRDRLAAGGTAAGGVPGSAGDGAAVAEAADLCFSANTGRSHLRHRLAAVGATRADLASLLGDFVDGLPGDEPVFGEATGGDVVFLFTGQGPQRVGMARRLYQTQPTFRRVLEECDEITRPLLATPLLSVLYPEDESSTLVYDMTYAHPALFAIQYSLAALWRSWGVEPVAVLGHSFGEYVAACVAGAMTLEDGLRLIVDRGRLMATLAETGAMAAVFAAEDEVATAIAGQLAHVSIAAVNGPTNTVISGERDVVAALCADFAARGIQTKQLHISTSSHSPLVEPILDELVRAARQVRFVAPRIPLVSNLTGELWPWDQAPDAEYWRRHARQPVRFAASLATLRGMGYRDFLEIGPAPTLLGMISESGQADRDALLLPSLRPMVDDWQVLSSTVSRLYTHGVNVDWRGFDADYARTRVSVPTYAFEKTACWPEGSRPETFDESTRGADAAGADAVDPAADDDLLYRIAWHHADPHAGASADVPAADAGAEASTDASSRTWVVLGGSGGGVGDRLAAAVAERGGRCVRVTAGDTYRYDAAGEAVVRRDDPATLARLLDDLGLGADDTLDVVHLWALPERAEAPDSVAALLAGQEDGCMSAARVAQALARFRGGRSSRLWLVTQGAVRPDHAAPSGGSAGGLAGGSAGSTNAAPVAVGQATLWGLGRSLQQEHAAIWGGLVDLDPAGEPDSLARQLLAEIEHRDREDQIALRDGERYVARLVRATVPETPARAGVWRRDASYLITGGLGGLGLAVARSLAQAGARRLVLVGRTALPPRAEWANLAEDDPLRPKVDAVRELEALGSSVVLESLDVSDEGAVRDFLDRYEREGWPAIRGVVHSAGMGEVAPLLDLTPADLERHLRPKAVGAWVLDRVFADRALDFFVLFSSTSSMLSSPFVASYAAANAFIDALAQARRDAGKPGLSINWGIWESTGLAARGAESTPGLSRGMGTLTPDQALRALHRLLRLDPSQVEAQIAVVPVDWAEWGRRYQEVSGSPLLTALVDGQGRARATRTAAKLSHLPTRDTLLALPVPERLTMLAEHLVRGVAATLGTKPTAIRPEQSLFELGLDSLMAVELRNEVERQLSVSLPISVLLEGASVRSLTEQIVRRLGESEAAAGANGHAANGHPNGHANGHPDGQAGAGTAEAAPAITRATRPDDVAARLLAEIDGMSDEQARAALGSEA
jgi:acyl transferase domain-containing protein/acyl carrier protein